MRHLTSWLLRVIELPKIDDMEALKVAMRSGTTRMREHLFTDRELTILADGWNVGYRQAIEDVEELLGLSRLWKDPTLSAGWGKPSVLLSRDINDRLYGDGACLPQ